jgi:uncharacterized repeat protein (TIGR03837 family)
MLELRALPFMPQPDYDRLLGVCDINFVRGEDSLVRALWAARPCIWQPYPQDAGAHCDKLDAYLERLRAAADASQRDALEGLCRLQRLWSGCALADSRAQDAPAAQRPGAAQDDLDATWTALVGQLPALRSHARTFSDRQAAIPDLASSLVSFCRDQLK